MHRRRVLTALFLTPVVIGTLAACGGAPAASTAPAAGIPLYAEAKPLQSGSPMAAAIESVKEAAKKEQGADVKVEAYTLPTDTKFEQVKKFYGDEMTKRSWKEVQAQQGAVAVPGGGTATWLKDDKEVLLIMVMPDPTKSGGPILVVTQGVNPKK